jgi:hypothetical protein
VEQLLIHPPHFSGNLNSGHLVAKQEKLEGNYAYCLAQYLFHTLCRKILRHGADGFTSLPNEVVLRIFIVFTNPSLSAGF